MRFQLETTPGVAGRDISPTILTHVGADDYWYVATPYTLYPEDLGGLEGAFREASRVTGRLSVDHRIPVYSPIAECHPIGIAADIDLRDAMFWHRFLQPKLHRAFGIIAVRMDTWEKSRGMKHELTVHREMNRPIVYCDPE